MGIERTLVLLKPDCIRRGLVGEVISRIEKKGYYISEIKSHILDEACLREHYAHIADKPFFPRILSYMTSGYVIAMIVEGESVIQEMRKLIGATNFTEAPAGTIRGDFACNPRENIIHASDTPENAEAEIQRFFG
jgi:nucleoside-diphosphate kinase